MTGDFDFVSSKVSTTESDICISAALHISTTPSVVSLYLFPLLICGKSFVKGVNDKSKCQLLGLSLLVEAVSNKSPFAQSNLLTCATVSGLSAAHTVYLNGGNVLLLDKNSKKVLRCT